MISRRPIDLFSIRGARVLAGLRLQDLADAAGLSVPYLSQIERGRRRLTPDVARRIADALKAAGQ